METFTHRLSGATITGTRLAPDATIEPTDRHDFTNGKWELAGNHAGCRVPAGDQVFWVRPDPDKTDACWTKGTFSPEARAAADEFFAHKKAHPESVPYEQLTPLQKRMQSGDL